MIRTGTTSVRLLQAISLMASLAIFLWSLGLSPFSLAEAASLTDVKNTLSDSDIAVASNHEIEYVIPAGSAGVEAGETIVVSFPNGFNLSTSSATTTDIDLEIDGVDETIVVAAPAVGEWLVGISGQDLTFTSGGAGATIGANATVTIKVGTNADGGTNQVTNHASAGSYEFDIVSGTGANNDSGSTRIAILDNVDVTASVDTIFNFTVAGFPTATGVAINGTSTTATSSATEIPFGVLTANEIVTAAQRLNVSTNASQGFVVTVEQDQNLLSATGADIDGFANGAYTNTPAAWSSPTAVIGTEDTYGHWGITSGDDLNAGEFSADLWVAASTTPREIFENSGPADGVTDNVGSTTVGFQVEISSLQEAGDDYSTTLTYIATPTF